MKLSTAIESLFAGERTQPITCTRTRAGYCLELVTFGRRLIVDLVR